MMDPPTSGQGVVRKRSPPQSKASDTPRKQLKSANAIFTSKAKAPGPKPSTSQVLMPNLDTEFDSSDPEASPEDDTTFEDDGIVGRGNNSVPEDPHYQRTGLAEAARDLTVRAKRRPRTNEELFKMEKPRYNRLRRQTRYMYLLYFCRFHWDNIIYAIYGDELGEDQDSDLYQWAYWQMGEIVKGWKHRCIGKMLGHVRSILEQDDPISADLEGLMSEKAISKWFVRHFSSASFVEVFDFIAGHVDIDRSSPLAKHFVTTIYSSLAAKAKLHIDWVKGGHQGGIKFDKKAIGDYWDVMTIRDCWKALTVQHFMIKRKPTSGRVKGKGKNVVLPDEDDDLFVPELPKDLSPLTTA